MVYPKARFSNRLPNGDYLTLAVWPGKKDPAAEVLTIQLRHVEGETWTTTGRLAVYHASDGTYSKLPDREPQTETKEEEPSSPPNEESFDSFLEE